MKLVCSGFLVLVISQAKADVFVLQQLNFGTVAVIDNSTVGTLTVDKFGNTTVSSQLRAVTSASQGIFLIDGLPANTGISVALSHNATQMTPLTSSQEFFEFSLIEYSDYLVADVNGEAEISVGGTISTSGSGSLNFAQTDFRINYQITFLY